MEVFDCCLQTSLIIIILKKKSLQKMPAHAIVFWAHSCLHINKTAPQFLWTKGAEAAMGAFSFGKIVGEKKSRGAKHTLQKTNTLLRQFGHHKDNELQKNKNKKKIWKSGKPQHLRQGYINTHRHKHTVCCVFFQGQREFVIGFLHYSCTPLPFLLAAVAISLLQPPS